MLSILSLMHHGAFLVLMTVTPSLDTVYVDQANPNCAGADGTQAKPFCTIQEGIQAALDGDTVAVASGTYVESVNFSGKNITVLSTSGAASTVIDGGGASTVVTIANGEGPSAILDGFTVTNGDSGGFGGGGVFIAASSPTISNNRIIGNTGYAGAGVYFIESSAPTISNNTISGNSSLFGGGIFGYGNDTQPAYVLNNTISENFAYYGSAIASFGSVSLIFNNTITANQYGGAILTYIGSLTYLANNTVADNVASELIGFSSPVNILAGGTAILINETITRNGSSPAYAAISVVSSSALVYSTIAWGNSVEGITNGGSSVGVYYSNIGGGVYPGPGNIDADPQFLDPAAGDFRLGCQSPCIDAGFLGAFSAQDFEGDDRQVDGDSDDTVTVDMGADEFDMLWQFQLSGTTFQFNAQAPPIENGNTALVFISLGNGSTGGILIPGTGGLKLPLDNDPLFAAWLGQSSILTTVTLTSCPGASTVTANIPLGAPPGFQGYYAGLSFDGGLQVISITPAKIFTLP
ncbi:MAG: right-handed parallel beta-helix repeat-containing protein [Planctomycetota bacterium]